MNINERLKAELTRLHNTGVNLINAMQVEQFPEEMEAHFTNNLKKDFNAFRSGLPNFNNTYQAWFSEAQLVISRYLPGRIADFNGHYEAPKGRREVRKDNYTISDYIKGIIITAGFDKKPVAVPADAIPLMQQQLNILDSVYIRFDRQLAESEALVMAAYADNLLQKASELLNAQLGRSAGAVCSVVIEQHLEAIRKEHQLKPVKKTMAINDYNELFKNAGLYDVGTFRQVQYLGELRDLCLKNKKVAPTEDQIKEMIDLTSRFIRTVS